MYGYTNAGDLISITDEVTGADNLTATYDGLHRLHSATGVWGTWGYTYDTLNNLRARTAGSNGLDYRYDANNRLTAIDGHHPRDYTYNAKGEVTGDRDQRFTLSCRGQLLTLEGVAKYTYDGHGRRLKKHDIASGTSEYALYDASGTLTTTWDTTRQAWTNFISLGGTIIAEETHTPGSGQRSAHYLHADLLGSPRMATSDTILWREHYDPYGQKLNGVADKIGYTGHAHDQESGYTYMQARFYDAQVGRFLSTDPIHFKDDNPFTFNRYSYANNNPYRYTDPDGRKVVIVGDKEFKQEVKAQLKELKATPTGKKIVAALEKSKQTFTISKNKGSSQASPTNVVNAQNGKGSGGTIGHDTKWTPTVNTPDGPAATPSKVVLGHELSHAVAYEKGTLDRSENPATGVRRSEEEAMEVENKIRQEMKLPERKEY